MNNSNQPIGIFDSGVGGTSIFKEVHKLLPNEDIIYLSDSKNAPYGEKPRREIINLSTKNTDLLIQKKAKLIIVACNTATTNAIELLRNSYSLPFIGIEPAIKPATLATKNNRIGILATKGTLSSELFHKTYEDCVNKNIRVIEVIGKGLVEAVESGKTNDPKFIRELTNQLEVFKKNKIDSLVLGCTHFPYLIPMIQKQLPSVKIIDSGQAVAKQTRRVLAMYDLLNKKNSPGQVNFYSNTNTDILNSLVNNQENNFKSSYLDF